MPARPWRFDPGSLRPGAPFRVRGMIYLSMLDYARKSSPGGVNAVRDELGQHAADVDQLFLASSSYEIAPLVRMAIAMAAIERRDVGPFIQARAYDTANADLRGIFRLLLKLASPEATAQRLWKAFNGYFEPCRAETDSVTRGRLTARLSGIPTCIDGWYVFAVEGFVTRALELAGAKAIAFTWGTVTPEEGATSRIAFEVGWT